MISKEEFNEWVSEGVAEGSSYMVILYDDSSNEYFPKYFYDKEIYERYLKIPPPDMLYIKCKVDLNGEISENVIKSCCGGSDRNKSNKTEDKPQLKKFKHKENYEY
jgi:hypothetical protein